MQFKKKSFVSYRPMLTLVCFSPNAAKQKRRPVPSAVKLISVTQRRGMSSRATNKHEPSVTQRRHTDDADGVQDSN